MVDRLGICHVMDSSEQVSPGVFHMGTDNLSLEPLLRRSLSKTLITWTLTNIHLICRAILPSHETDWFFRRTLVKKFEGIWREKLIVYCTTRLHNCCYRKTLNKWIVSIYICRNDFLGNMVIELLCCNVQRAKWQSCFPNLYHFLADRLFENQENSTNSRSN